MSTQERGSEKTDMALEEQGIEGPDTGSGEDAVASDREEFEGLAHAATRKESPAEADLEVPAGHATGKAVVAEENATPSVADAEETKDGSEDDALETPGEAFKKSVDLEEHGESPVKTGVAWLIILALTGLAGYLRFRMLDLKPLHHDEGVNGWFIIKLLSEGKYRYNPGNYHGPLLYVLHTLAVIVGGKSVVALRFMTALFGTLAVPSLVLFRRQIGWLGVFFMAAFAAVAPIEIYFSRTAIHEIYNFIFNFTLLGGIAAFARTRRPGFLILSAISMACLFGTKETTIITVAAIIPALGIALLFGVPSVEGFGFREARDWLQTRLGVLNTTNGKLWVVVLIFPISLPALFMWYVADVFKLERRTRIHIGLAFVITWALLFSFWLNPKGLGDFFQAFFRWGHTGTAGKGHQKPWSYFFTHLLWPYYRPLVLWGGIGLVWSALRRERLALFSLAWLVLALIAYSTIPYKTPWCVLSFSGALFIGIGLMAKQSLRVVLQGPVLGKLVNIGVLLMMAWACVLFGFPVQQDLRARIEPPKRSDLASTQEVVAKSIARIFIPRRSAWVINFDEYDVKGHSFIYVQNVREYMDLINDLYGLIDAAQLEGDEKKPRILMIDAKNPMRWYLKKLGKQDWRRKLDAKAKKLMPNKVDIVVTAKKFTVETKKILGDDFMFRRYQERPGRKIDVYIRKTLWKDYLEAVKAGHAYKPSGKFKPRSFSDRMTAQMRETWFKRGMN